MTASDTRDATPPVHIINHTHWDREWFLTHEYTTGWIPELIDGLAELVELNPDYNYLFDGQTLAIEDLLKLDPSYSQVIKNMVSAGSLTIGPLYSQPDWKITGGETLLRNVLYGTSDVAAHGGDTDVAWLVDTFGHISQAPQILQMFGIDSAYVWRGAPQLEPLFTWEAADGTSVQTVNLFGGYRNLYGVTRTGELAERRLETEVGKLRPYYNGMAIPLFDGYDLETEPEDPVRFYETEKQIPDGIEIHSSTPRGYLDAVSAEVGSAPLISGELLSGKVGATFPGTLTSRIHLKILHNDCERQLFSRAEPLAAMAQLVGREYGSDRYEQWGRSLLQNAVHDCICGVSIDQVHERMDHSYQAMHHEMNADIDESLSHVMSNFKAGQYLVSTSSQRQSLSFRSGDQHVVGEVKGVGVSPILETQQVEYPERPAVDFRWENDHYSSTLNNDGTFTINGSDFGRFVLTKDVGDTYSAELAEQLGVGTVVEPPVVESETAYDAVVRYTVALQGQVAKTEVCSVRAEVRLTFDRSPMVRMSVELDSTGTGYALDVVCDTGIDGVIRAGMPFDIVERQPVDNDLMPFELEPDLTRVLMGQREVEQVTSFPFHDHVTVTGPDKSVALFARGLRSYQVDPSGALSVTLRRSNEWLAVSGLKLRSGDAGPLMYVPDARCERVVHHELAFAVSDAFDADQILSLNELVQNPPMVVTVDSTSAGSATEWTLFSEQLPMSALHCSGERVLARLYNPTDADYSTQNEYRSGDVRGEPGDNISAIKSKKIQTLVLDEAKLGLPGDGNVSVAGCEWNEPALRAEPNRSVPNPKIVDSLSEDVAELTLELTGIEAELESLEGDEWHLANHRRLVVARGLAELELSIELNNRKMAVESHQLSLPDDPDPEIQLLAQKLNDLRIQRRIYDYVAEMLTFKP